MLRGAQIGVAAATTLTVLVATGCGGDRASDAPITSERTLADVCQRQTYFTRAPAVSASLPRPILVFEERHKNLYGREFFLRAGEGFRLVDPERYQLVACSKRSGDGAKVKDCEFEGATVPLHDATFEVTVYEAKTRKPRKTVSIVGKDHTCPTLQVFGIGEDRKIFSNPTPAQYVAALGDQVQP